MAIELTAAAAERIRTQLEKRGHGMGLRLGVRKSGCSGFAYTIDYADAVDGDDVAFEQHGVNVVVAQKNLRFLDGMRLDYRREGINEAFKFDNPNVRDECGCGESFSI